MSRGPWLKPAHVRTRWGYMQKRCSKCHGWKYLSELTKQAGCIGGRSSVCKRCDNARWEANKLAAERERVAG